MRSVGKTTILEQLIYGSVTQSTEFYPTIEDIYVSNIETERGTKEKLCFYDTAGLLAPAVESSPSTGYQSLPKHYMAFADGYVLVYDICKPESLSVLIHLHKDIEKNKDKKDVSYLVSCLIFLYQILSTNVLLIIINNYFQAVIIVLGNKTGQPDPKLQENTITKANNWCRLEKLRHFEVTAMERYSLYEPFIFLSTKLNPAPTKSSFPQIPALTKLTQKGAARTDS